MFDEAVQPDDLGVWWAVPDEAYEVRVCELGKMAFQIKLER